MQIYVYIDNTVHYTDIQHTYGHMAVFPLLKWTNVEQMKYNTWIWNHSRIDSNRFESSWVLRMVSHIPLPPRLDIHSFRSPTANIPGLVEIVEEDDEFSPLEDIEVEDMDASEGWGIWIQWFEGTCATWPDVTPMKGLEFAFAERVDLIFDISR